MGLQTPQRLRNGKHFHVCWKPSELLSCVLCYIQYVHASVCNPCWHRGELKQGCGQLVGKPAREHISLTPRPYWVFCVFTCHLPCSPPSPTTRETCPRQEPARLQYLKLPRSEGQNGGGEAGFCSSHHFTVEGIKGPRRLVRGGGGRMGW